MRRKGIFTLLTAVFMAVFMVLAFTAVTFAANKVVLETTVPNIPKSTCYKAGTNSLAMDHFTKMAEGDVIQFTLTNTVTVCKDIEMFLSLGTGVLSADSNLAVSASQIVDVLNFVGLGTGTDMGFLIVAKNGDLPANQIVTMTLRSRIIATGELLAVNTARTVQFNASLGDPSTDKLIIRIFDGKITPTQWFKDNTPTVATKLYIDAIVEADNALCIDTLTQNYMGEYVENNPDSIPGNFINKLTFSGDYRIAHIMSEVAYNVYVCKGAVAGHISMPTTSQAACVAFDFETTTGYCTDHTASKAIVQSSQPFEVTNYTTTMEILVNGVAGEHGVYWSSTAPTVGTYKTVSDVCAAGVPAGALGAISYLRGDGTTVAVPVGAISACDAVAAAAKAVILKTGSSLLFNAGDYFLQLNLPPFNWNLAEVKAGDVVSVRVTLSKATCGSIGTFIIPIGTFGCAATGGKILFPYFTSLSADDFWNGIAIVNTGSTAGTATLTAYEKDGSVGTFTTPSIPANSMYVNLLESITWSGTGLGGSQCYIEVKSTNIPTANLDGFGMIAKETSGESMGYLPRK